MSAKVTETVRERPILFSGAMVRAILDGRKSQTRRVVKPQAESYRNDALGQLQIYAVTKGVVDPTPIGCPYGAPGDTLWVRETFLPRGNGTAAIYRVDHSDADAAGLAGMYSDRGWKPSIYMPRELSRLSLRITQVRVERLHDISEDDARAEGMGTLPAGTDEDGHPFDASDHRTAFRVGWDTINGKRAPWASNPWVWVVSFEEAGRVGN